MLEMYPRFRLSRNVSFRLNQDRIQPNIVARSKKGMRSPDALMTFVNRIENPLASARSIARRLDEAAQRVW